MTSYTPSQPSRTSRLTLWLTLGICGVFLLLTMSALEPELLFSGGLFVSMIVFLYIAVRYFLVEYTYTVSIDGSTAMLDVITRQGKRSSLLAHISLHGMTAVWVSDSEIPLPDKAVGHLNYCRSLRPERFVRLVLDTDGKTETVDLEYDDALLSALHTALMATDEDEYEDCDHYEAE